MLLTGVAVLLYPSVANCWNRHNQSAAVYDYETEVEEITRKKHREMIAAAEEYNAGLRKLDYPLAQYRQLGDTKSILTADNSGIIGYVKIKKLNIEIPIRYGSDKVTLNSSAGLLEGTSFPIGGKGTHAVIVAHSGLPSSELFTNIGKLEEGDCFEITVLDRHMTYEVTQKKVVLPDNTEDLAIDRSNDYCSLVTCTPYGVNTHRLIVRGVRNDSVGDGSLSSRANDRAPFRYVWLAAADVVLLCCVITYLIRNIKKRLKRRWK